MFVECCSLSVACYVCACCSLSVNCLMFAVCC